MDKGTGLSKPSVIAGLKAAVERGLLIEETDDSDRARIRKFYRLHMVEDGDGNAVREADLETPGFLEETGEVGEGGVKDLNAEVKTFNRGVKTLYPGGKETLPRTEKETTERHLQERNSNNNTYHAPSPDTAVVVASLVDHGIARGVAQQLAAGFAPDHIGEKIEYLDFLLVQRPNDVQKPAAWLRRAIEKDFGAPDGFVSAAERQRQAEDEKQRAQALVAAQQEHFRLTREREADRTRRREAALIQLKSENGTTDDDEALWKRIVEAVEASGENALYGLLANTQILKSSDTSLLIGIPSDIYAKQLTHPRMEAYLKRLIKKQVQRELELQFLRVDGLA
jgi:hypothetical protein